MLLMAWLIVWPGIIIVNDNYWLLVTICVCVLWWHCVLTVWSMWRLYGSDWLTEAVLCVCVWQQLTDDQLVLKVVQLVWLCQWLLTVMTDYCVCVIGIIDWNVCPRVLTVLTNCLMTLCDLLKQWKLNIVGMVLLLLMTPINYYYCIIIEIDILSIEWHYVMNIIIPMAVCD